MRYFEETTVMALNSDLGYLFSKQKFLEKHFQSVSHRGHTSKLDGGVSGIDTKKW